MERKLGVPGSELEESRGLILLESMLDKGVTVSPELVRQLVERVRELSKALEPTLLATTTSGLRTPNTLELTPEGAALLLPHINRKKPARYVEAWERVDELVEGLKRHAAGARLTERFLPCKEGKERG